MIKNTGGISGSRASTEPSGLGPSGFDPGRADFTIAEILAWARTKPANERYSYISSCGCAIAQFVIETDRGTAAFPGWFRDVDGEDHSFDGRIDDAALGPDRDSQTFGQFVKRLESVTA